MREPINTMLSQREPSAFDRVLMDCYEEPMLYQLWPGSSVFRYGSEPVESFEQFKARYYENKRLTREIGPVHGHPDPSEVGQPYRRGRFVIPFGTPGEYRKARNA